ncbi:MAG TPA: RDD family protein [Capillimicrobium sp.]|nr:RDD family protein [Capillimicrobium sp.]
MSDFVPPVEPPPSSAPAPPPPVARAAATAHPRLAAEARTASASPYAGLATRVLAFAADAIVVNVVGWLVAGIVSLGLSLLDIPAGVEDTILAIGSLCGLVWSGAYFVFFWSTTGQTPGNRLMRIRVLDARTNAPPRARRALLRLIVLPLSAIPLCAGFLLILVDKRRRALHDRIARTVVADVAGEPEPVRSDARPRRHR